MKVIRITLAVTAAFWVLSATPAKAEEITCGSMGEMNRCPL